MTANAQTAELVGAVLSRRFRLTRLLGEGGMGVVYAAEEVDAGPTRTPVPGQAVPVGAGSLGGGSGAGGRKVAIKILKPEFVTDAGVLGRFLEEGRTCQRLIHPNILRVFECGEAEDGAPYIVMELLEGVPLSAYTANGGRVPPTQAVTILQGMLAGLAAAHSQGVIHRDLKPENVFLAREANGRFQVKLLDFGIAKVMDVAGGMGAKTKTGVLLGTPAYMSPEQIRSAKDVDARTDIWSAGVMGYEMLSGRVAFPAPTEYARLAAVLNTNPEPLDAIDPSLVPLSPLISRAMQKDPTQRFQSALEMARALSPPSAGSEVSAARLHVMPLSRLPEVPSLYAPTSEASPAASSERKQSVASAVPATDLFGKAPGGTLASATARSVHDPSPNILVVAAAEGSTMPSKDLPMLEAVTSGRPRFARGISMQRIVFLVVVALIAGFVLGFVVARSM